MTDDEQRLVDAVTAKLEGLLYSSVHEGWGRAFCQSVHYEEVKKLNKPITESIPHNAVLYTVGVARGMPKISHVTIYPDGRVIGRRA